MNPFINAKIEGEDAEEYIAKQALRFARSGFSSLLEWLSLDEVTQNAIIASRNVIKAEEAQILSAIVANPIGSAVEFSKPFDGGKLANKVMMDRAAQAIKEGLKEEGFEEIK
jgi:hypothetical protein